MTLVPSGGAINLDVRLVCDMWIPRLLAVIAWFVFGSSRSTSVSRLTADVPSTITDGNGCGGRSICSSRSYGRVHWARNASNSVSVL